MTQHSVEYAVWRWAALVALLASAFLLARSWRHVPVEDCQASGGMLICFAFDRWTGDVSARSASMEAGIP
jgi:hypothetical protein